MASVQELILASQAQQVKKPGTLLAEIINAGVGGWEEGTNIRNKRLTGDLTRAEIAKTLIETQRLEAEKEAQEELRKQFAEKVAISAEKNLRDGQARVAKPKTLATPAAKFTEEWTQDAKGNVSRSIKEISATAPKTLDEGLMAEVNAGRMTLKEAHELKNKPPIDRAMQTQIAKARAELADTRPIVDSAVIEIDRVQKLNEKSYGGYYGAMKMKAMSATDAGKDNEEFKNTADVLNTMQGLVSKVLKSTFGGQLSDGERQYLNQVYGALPTMSRVERDIAMTNVRTMLTNRLKGASSKVEELSGEGASPAADPNAGEGQKRISVIRLSDDKPGTILESDFDPSKYKRN